MAARARICTSFQTGTDPDGTDIPILAGAVTLDGTADIRGSLDLTSDGTGLWPTRAADLFAPYGNEVFVQRGVQYSTATTEWCSLGYFRLEAPEQRDPPDGPIRIVAKDRMAGIVDARLMAPAQFAATATYGGVVTQLVQEVYPSATVLWDDSSDSMAIGRDVIVEESRYGFLNDLVRSLGKIWYWNHRGELYITDAPPLSAPVYSVEAGAGGVLVSMSRRLSRTGVYNAVVASGEAADSAAPVRGVAIDQSPTSPTYFYGSFGPVPKFYSSPFLTTDAQAVEAATAELGRILGLPYNVNFATVANPALEPFDPVRIRASSSSGAETHVLETVTVPLTAQEAMTATTREQTVVLIGSVP
jgi:hypothetical protein